MGYTAVEISDIDDGSAIWDCLASRGGKMYDVHQFCSGVPLVCFDKCHDPVNTGLYERLHGPRITGPFYSGLGIAVLGA